MFEGVAEAVLLKRRYAVMKTGLAALGGGSAH